MMMIADKHKHELYGRIRESIDREIEEILKGTEPTIENCEALVSNYCRCHLTDDQSFVERYSAWRDRRVYAEAACIIMARITEKEFSDNPEKWMDIYAQLYRDKFDERISYKGSIVSFWNAQAEGEKEETNKMLREFCHISKDAVN